MFEAVAGIFALGVAAQVVFWIVVSVLFPVFWLWMLIDAALRDDVGFPSGSVNEKLIWLVAMFFVQPVALAYFFVVYRAGQRSRQAAAAASVTAVPGSV